jgi:NAD(P)-dependent dehydrogenase (short-subunit alcohol dehydrogenase family)
VWKPLEVTTIAEWDRTFAVNVRAAACLCAAVLPGMQARRFGRIINIGSEAGVAIVPGLAAYCVSKHALRALTEVIQDGNHHNGIKAWVVCPGFVDTDMGYVVPGADPREFPAGRGGGGRGPVPAAHGRQCEAGPGDLAAHDAQPDGDLARGDRHD